MMILILATCNSPFAYLCATLKRQREIEKFTQSGLFELECVWF